MNSRQTLVMTYLTPIHKFVKGYLLLGFFLVCLVVCFTFRLRPLFWVLCRSASTTKVTREPDAKNPVDKDNAPILLTHDMVLNCIGFVVVLMFLVCLICLYWSIIQWRFALVNIVLNKNIDAIMQNISKGPNQCDNINGLNQLLPWIHKLQRLTRVYFAPGSSCMFRNTMAYVQDMILNYRRVYCNDRLPL